MGSLSPTSGQSSPPRIHLIIRRSSVRQEGRHHKTAEVKATCWALVTKLLKVLFQEIHKVRMFVSELGNIRDDNARVNGLFLYAALEELRILREFASHDYRRHPKYNQCVVLHLFDTSLLRSVYEKRANNAGRDALRWGVQRLKFLPIIVFF